MNDYRRLRLDITPCSEAATDVAAALLAPLGFETFEPDETGLTAYCPEGLFNLDEVDAMIASFPIPGVEITRSHSLIEGRDWNTEWEMHHFTPIVIDGRCVVHSSAHTDIPACTYDVVINPCQSFGTGHHATTSLIVTRLLDMPLEGKAVMDMGTGTGILAILCAMRGAARVDAVEIDPMAHANALENCALNNVGDRVAITLGDASALPTVPTYDLFIANINRNIVTADMARYAATLRPGAEMLLSGFFTTDVPIVEAEAAKFGLRTLDVTSQDDWACLRLTFNP